MYSHGPHKKQSVANPLMEERHLSSAISTNQKENKALPRDFALKIFNLEIQCEKPDATQEHMNELMDLYTMAIEYYNCTSDIDNQEYF